MSKRFNNRTLLLVFIGLAVLLLITRFTGARKTERSMLTNVAAIDTSQVTSFSIYPAAEEGAEIRFTREGSVWRVNRGEMSAPASLTALRSILAEIVSLEASQLVARGPDKWETYQVSDSMGTRLVVREGKKVTLDMIAGRFQYQPPPQNSYNMYGQNQVTGKTYIRLSGADEVYSVDGFFALSVNQGFNRWRDNTLTRISLPDLSRIRFDYPSDSGFVAQKSENGWMVAGLQADSANMQSFLNRISRTSFNEFADGGPPAGDPDFQLTLEGDHMSPVMVRAFSLPDSTFVMNSSLNPETWFKTNDAERFEGIFPGSAALMAERN